MISMISNLIHPCPRLIHDIHGGELPDDCTHKLPLNINMCWSCFLFLGPPLLCISLDEVLEISTKLHEKNPCIKFWHKIHKNWIGKVRFAISSSPLFNEVIQIWMCNTNLYMLMRGQHRSLCKPSLYAGYSLQFQATFSTSLVSRAADSCWTLEVAWTSTVKISERRHTTLHDSSYAPYIGLQGSPDSTQS